MLITKKQLGRDLDTDRPVLLAPMTFIGMSGVGKSAKARRIQKVYFDEQGESVRVIEVDRRIYELMVEEGIIDPQKDYMLALSQYLGMPGMDGYLEREKKYLRYEEQALAENREGMYILDAPGSAIYNPEVMQKLKQTSLIVYLESGEERIATMIGRFLNNPKPLIWNINKGGKYNPENAEGSYRRLLQCRRQRYREYAEVTIPFEIGGNKSSTAQEFIASIYEQLPD